MDPNLKPFIRQELKKLGEAMRTMHTCQNKTYWDTTQEKWGPGGSKAKAAGRRRKCSQKATEEKTAAEKKTEHKERPECPATAQLESTDDADTEKNPDVKAEHSHVEVESGRASREGLDNKNL